jgi:hypothetical protein
VASGDCIFRDPKIRKPIGSDVTVGPLGGQNARVIYHRNHDFSQYAFFAELAQSADSCPSGFQVMYDINSHFALNDRQNDDDD